MCTKTKGRQAKAFCGKGLRHQERRDEHKEKARVPGWCNQVMYRYWILEREGEWIGGEEEDELSEEEQEQLARSKAHHPSRGPQPQDRM
jgi:hypothetical protein